MGVLDQAGEGDNDAAQLSKNVATYFNSDTNFESPGYGRTSCNWCVLKDGWRAGSSARIGSPAGKITLIEVSEVASPICPIVAPNDDLPIAALCSCFKHRRKSAARRDQVFHQHHECRYNRFARSGKSQWHRRKYGPTERVSPSALIKPVHTFDAPGRVLLAMPVSPTVEAETAVSCHSLMCA